MDSQRPIITPDMRVADLLRDFPELEERLIAFSPHYQALRNPVLQATVAKVATLRQVAKVGGVPLGTIVNTLRAAAGQQCADVVDAAESASARPAWADPAKVATTFDARELIEQGEHPMPQVMQGLAALGPGELYALVTPFAPAPLVDMAAGRGFEGVSVAEGPEVYRTYFRRA